MTFLRGKPFRRLESAWKNTQKAPSLFASCKGQPISFLNYFVSLWVPQNITKLHRRDSTNCKLVKYSQPKKYAFYRRSESYELWLLTKLMVIKPFWWPCRETSFIFQEKPQCSTQLATAHTWPGKFTHWLPSNSSTVHTDPVTLKWKIWKLTWQNYGVALQGKIKAGVIRDDAQEYMSGIRAA